MGKKNKKGKKKAVKDASKAAPSALRAYDPPAVLQPIYDAYHSRNHKLADKLLSKAIMQFGKHTIFLALYALVSVHLQEIERARHTLAEARRSGPGGSPPTDQAVLATMMAAYKLLDEPQEGRGMYEAAVKVQPKNEELLKALFTCLARDGAFKRQQEVSMKLYNAFKKPKYVVWAGLHLLLQTHSTRDAAASGPDKMMMLAEMMIRRTFPTNGDDDKGKETEGNGVEPSTVYTMIELLCRQGKHAQALSLAEGPHAEEWRKDMQDEAVRVVAGLCERLVQWEKASKVYETLLSGNPDDWADLCGYLRCRFQAAAAAAADNNKGDMDHIAVARAYVKGLAQAELDGDSPPRRGPFLAALEAERLELQRGAGSEAAAQDSLQAGLLSYFSRFGSKPCFFADVRAFVPLLSADRQRALAEGVKAAFESNPPAREDKRCRSRTSLEQLLRYTGVGSTDLDVNGLEAKADELCEAFMASQNIAAVSQEVTERGVGDDLLTLCVECLLDLYSRTSDTKYLRDAIACLELGLELSRYNFTFKLWLVRLYCHPSIAAMQRALDLFKSMDVKQIQTDSLSHLVLSDCVRLGMYREAHSVITRCLYFHRAYNRDHADLVGIAYRENNLNKVVEFCEFRERLLRSHTRVLCEQELRNLAPLLLEDLGAGEVHTCAVMQVELAAKRQKALQNALSGGSGAGAQASDDDDNRPHLVANQDYGLISTCTPPSAASDVAHVLNCPSHSLLLDSWALPCGAPVPAEDSSSGNSSNNAFKVHPVDISVLDARAALSQCLRLVCEPASERCIAVTEGNAVADIANTNAREMTAVLASLRTSIKACGLEGSPQWSLAVLVADTACKVSDAFGQGLAWMLSLKDDSAGDDTQQALDQHTQRWAAVTAQMAAIASGLEQEEKEVMQGYLLPKLANAVDIESGVLPPHLSDWDTQDQPFPRVNPAAIPRLAHTLSQPVMLVLASLSAWCRQVPTRKMYKKLNKKRPGSDSPGRVVEDKAIDAMCDARDGARDLAKAVTACLKRVGETVCPALETAARVAALNEEVKGSGVGDSGGAADVKAGKYVRSPCDVKGYVAPTEHVSSLSHFRGDAMDRHLRVCEEFVQCSHRASLASLAGLLNKAIRALSGIKM